MKSSGLSIVQHLQPIRTSLLLFTQQLQPIRTSQWILRTKNPNSGRRVFLTSWNIVTVRKTAWFRKKKKKKTFKVSNGKRSLMTRNVSCSQIKQITFIRMLDSDWNHRSYHQVRTPGLCGLIVTWWGCYALCLWHKLSELAHSLLFCSCVYFCLYGPFNCISFRKFSRQLSVFHSVLPVLLLPNRSFQLCIISLY